ncbi:hypothetical protein CRENBAI_026876 [Crenichthys baileyi]|uniref:Uncharacterized protein n=1 Tax=Crenichthys baileyi TaxID=28760 RepID=A0AAV9RHB4_9TELE
MDTEQKHGFRSWNSSSSSRISLRAPARLARCCAAPLPLRGPVERQQLRSSARRRLTDLRLDPGLPAALSALPAGLWGIIQRKGEERCPASCFWSFGGSLNPFSQNWNHEAEPGGQPERRRLQPEQLAAFSEQQAAKSPKASMRDQTHTLFHFHSHFLD